MVENLIVCCNQPDWENTLLVEVEVLGGGAATDELGLGALDVDVLEEDLGLGLRDGHGLGGSDLSGDVVAGLLVDLLELLLSGNLPLEDSLLESGNGVVGGTHALDLLTGTVGGARVGHGVTTVAVGDVLEDHGALVGSGPLLTVLDGSLDGKDVHAVDLEARDVLTTLVVVGQGGGTGSRGTHTVLVVLTAEEGREVPELGHVEGLEDLTLVGGTITVEDDGGVLAALVLVGEGKAGSDRDLGTDDTVTAVEAGGEHVHGTTLTVGDTLTATEKLTNDGANGTTTHHGETVATVGGDDVVLGGDGMLDTSGNGLLTGRQVAETTDLLLLVQAIGGHFHLSVELLVRAGFFDDIAG